MAESLHEFKLLNLPDSVYYCPDFISESEEESLLQRIYTAPKPKWTNLSNRKLQNWGGLPHPKGMVQEKMPEWLDVYCRKVSALGIFDGKTANHVLINEYVPGQGIMPHTDGPLYFPTVANVTLASHGLLDFYRPIENQLEETCSGTSGCACDNTTTEQSTTSLSSRYVGSVLLQRRSLIVSAEAAYSTYLHGIRELHSDAMTKDIVNLDRCTGLAIGDTIERSKRVSLTIRVVPRVIKSQLFFGKK